MLRCSPLSIFPKIVILIDENLEKGRNFDKYGQMALAYPDFNDMSVFTVKGIQHILKSCLDLWFGTGRLTLQLTLINSHRSCSGYSHSRMTENSCHSTTLQPKMVNHESIDLNIEAGITSLNFHKKYWKFFSILVTKTDFLPWLDWHLGVSIVSDDILGLLMNLGIVLFTPNHQYYENLFKC